MKDQFKKIIVSLLGRQVIRLRARSDFTVVAVGGSVGKTGTKYAIATLLNQKLRVQYQQGNYNDIVTVPLVFFGITEPSLYNPFAWLLALIKTEILLHKDYPFDVVVLELGTDGPGQISRFSEYLNIDLAVVTAIADEHMEYFGSLDAVALEELELINISKRTIINSDLCDSKYLPNDKSFDTYGFAKADYQLTDLVTENQKFDFTIMKGESKLLASSYEGIAKSQLYSLLAATAVADILSVPVEEISLGIKKITAVNGRMNLLNGISNSTIIDDSYNSSPLAVKSALDALSAFKGDYKIAILGNMNELGNLSAAAHIEIGDYCNPRYIDLLATIGPDANQYLAAAAEKKGCVVERFDSPYKAGEWVKQRIKDGTIVLVKGSQNGVFAEESVKQLLSDKNDVSKLVRQSKYWLKIKQKQFTQRDNGVRK
ncbi:MAG: UDP-N-acetylmuramoyl-tripeptide--D-alanyl-D-alanine ligase [Candidatus Saccharibacteria bacterium]|nr:UDP-N-acetylmuramoyl-tripeptide--D-alanyl-D-alanine ligase [Candidatus Saccharibacteria bacterium]